MELWVLVSIAVPYRAAKAKHDGGPFVNERVVLNRIAFADLKGWKTDRLSEIIPVMERSCLRYRTGRAAPRPTNVSGIRSGEAFAGACKTLPDLRDRSNKDVRRFLETHFCPHEIVAEPRRLTSYYEPVVDGSLGPTDRFRYPLYGVPDDLVTHRTPDRGAELPAGLTGARSGRDGALIPYATREDIDDGALSGRGLELIWLDDPVDVYFIHIQGSARIRLPDGKRVRIGYGAKNGHPYVSVGKAMLADGVLSPRQATAEDMKAWMRENPDRARRYMHLNPSYVFFGWLDGLDPALGPVGGEGVPLTAGRSLAVDRSLYTYGLPFWVEADLPTGTDGAIEPFRRLMVAQDTGAAITGAARGDIFWGTGPEAGETAGRINNPARFVVLLPCASSTTVK